MEEQDDVEENELDKEDEDSVGSYQSLVDDPDNATGSHEVNFTNWMVAKILAFSTRERTQASVTRN